MKTAFLFAGASAGALALGAFTSPAFAQGQPATGAQTDGQQTAAEARKNEGLVTTPDAATGPELAENTTDRDIVVTGSRIRLPNLTSTVPITSVSVQELTNTGDVSLGDALNEMPALRATWSQANSTAFIGTSGSNWLDLRGLGTLRTLVMVNGRRHITSQPGIPQRIDVNTIPVDLLERVDIVTGGSSAIYGSDAIAGTVNFITRRNFDGIKLRGQGGISDEGDRGTYTIAGTFGKNFAQGRGNVAISAEYAFSDDLYYADRDDLYGAYSGRRQFQLTDSTLNEPAAGDGIPDFTFLTGIRNMSISDGGLYASVCPALTANPSAALLARRAANCTGVLRDDGAELGYVYVFDANGNLVRNIPTVDFRTVQSGNGQGGLGSTLRQTGQLIPALERYGINLLAHFDVSDAFRPFVEAKYVHITANQEGQATSLATLGNTLRLDNPFLSSQARTLLQTSLAPGATTFSIARFNVDFGGRGEEHVRETYRLVGGLEGDFNDDWHYELSANYGEFTSHMDALNRVNRARYNRAIDAATNGAGQIVCRVNADANTTNDDPACVPLNVFGEGAPSQAAVDYITADVQRDQKATQFDLLATVAGDFSQVFSLWGGPIAWALGAEYRRETAFAAYDPETAAGATDHNVIPDFAPPILKVKEAFGEVRFPILADRPFARELSLSAAGRLSDYNIGPKDTVKSWNLSGIYSPVQGLRFRAGYAKAVRAPTQAELFNPLTQTFANSFVDPCSQTNINNGTANRAQNCAAAGIPTTEVIGGVTVPWTNNTSQGIRGLNGANPNLSEETAKSLTIGFVAQPKLVPGLAVAVDYYRIKVGNAINSLTAQTVANLCYDSTTGIDNQYCANIFRRPDGTFFGQQNRGVGGTFVNFTLTPEEAGFIQGGFNYAQAITRGIDFDVSYRRQFGKVTLNTRGILSYLLDRDNYTNVLDPTFRDTQKFELGDPEFSGTLSTTLDFGVFDVSHNMRYVGKQTIDLYETQNAFDGRAPTDADKYPRIWYPQYLYHNIRFGIEPKGTRYRFYAGVDNLTDKAPPFGLDGTGNTGITSGAGAIFDNVGRFFYAGFEVKLR